MDLAGKICFLLLLFSASLAGQSQMGKHTLFFYPFHSGDPIGAYRNLRGFELSSFISEPKDFVPRKENLLLGMGYNFHFKEAWALQAKFFAMQNFTFGFFGQKTLVTNKRMKLGVQHFILNRKWQIGLGYSLYYRNEKNVMGFISDDLFGSNVFVENEFGLELGIGLAYRFGKHVRMFLGNAFHFGVRGTNIQNKRIKEFLPFESLGFGYTF